MKRSLAAVLFLVLGCDPSADATKDAASCMSQYPTKTNELCGGCCRRGIKSGQTATGELDANRACICTVK